MMEFPPGAFEETQRRIAGGAMARNGVKVFPTAQLQNMTFKTFLIEGEQRANNILLKKWILLLEAQSFTGELDVGSRGSLTGKVQIQAQQLTTHSRIDDLRVHALLIHIL